MVEVEDVLFPHAHDLNAFLLLMIRFENKTLRIGVFREMKNLFSVRVRPQEKGWWYNFPGSLHSQIVSEQFVQFSFRSYEIYTCQRIIHLIVVW